MKIRFTKQPSARSGGSEYEVGEVVDLPDVSARRWVRRGVATEVSEGAEVETAAIDPAAETATPKAMMAKTAMMIILTSVAHFASRSKLFILVGLVWISHRRRRSNFAPPF